MGPVPLAAGTALRPVGADSGMPVFRELGDPPAALLDFSQRARQVEEWVAQLRDPRVLEIYRTAIASIDQHKVCRFQERYAEQLETFVAVYPRGYALKYADIAYWIGHKARHAALLELDRRPTSTILDIGTGGAHFLAIAKAFGHRVLGIDAFDDQVYLDLGEVFGVEMRCHRVTARQPLPDFSRRFDIVTAIWTTFNNPVDDDYWSLDEWRFFFDDLRRNQVRLPASVLLELNQERRPGGAEYNTELLRWAEAEGAVINLDEKIWLSPGLIYFRWGEGDVPDNDKIEEPEPASEALTALLRSKQGSFGRTLHRILDGVVQTGNLRIAEHAVAQWAGASRRQSLVRLYRLLTAGCGSEAETFMAITHFARTGFFHGDGDVLLSDGEWCNDPLYNLTSELLQCSELARLVIDLFATAGTEARLVLLNEHQTAELRLGDAWRCLDADMVRFRQEIVRPDGKGPSVIEIWREPALADRVLPYAERQILGLLDERHRNDEKFNFYMGHVYRPMPDGTGGPRYVQRAAGGPEAWENGRHYGWKPVEIFAFPEVVEAPLPSLPRRRRPDVPRWLEVSRIGDRLHLQWSASRPLDDAAVRYRLDIASRPRLWTYPKWLSADGCRPYAAAAVTGAAFDPDNVDFLPNNDVASISTEDAWLTMELQGLPDTVFLSVSACDSYGDAVGNQRYLPSDELVVYRR
jgi:SAM-dependent methyltransferase